MSNRRSVRRVGPEHRQIHLLPSLVTEPLDEWSKVPGYWEWINGRRFRVLGHRDHSERDPPETYTRLSQVVLYESRPSCHHSSPSCFDTRVPPFVSVTVIFLLSFSDRSDRTTITLVEPGRRDSEGRTFSHSRYYPKQDSLPSLSRFRSGQSRYTVTQRSVKKRIRGVDVGVWSEGRRERTWYRCPRGCRSRYTVGLNTNVLIFHCHREGTTLGGFYKTLSTLFYVLKIVPMVQCSLKRQEICTEETRP